MDLMKQLHAHLFLSFTLFSVVASAQDFNTNEHDTNRQNAIAAAEPTHNNVAVSVNLATSNSDWSKEEDRVLGSISRSKLAKMKAVTGALVDFLRDTCIGEGVYNPSWHGEYFSGKNSPGAQLRFGVSCHFAEQDADLNITANDIQPLVDQLAVNGQHFLTVRVGDSVSNGVLYYTDAAATPASRTKMWLITTGKALPFIPVTRKEYLTEAKAELTTMVNSIVAGWQLKVPVRPAAVQEAEKNAAIGQLKAMYAGSELDVRMRLLVRNYKTDQEYQSENIGNETAGYVATIHLMDSLMTHLGAVALAKPAVVSVDAADFQGFEDGPGSYMLARINPAYFNNELSEEKPQLFVVSWHYDPSNLSASVLDKELAEGICGRGLLELLSK
jgi:hypothetical protein